MTRNTTVSMREKSESGNTIGFMRSAIMMQENFLSDTTIGTVARMPQQTDVKKE